MLSILGTILGPLLNGISNNWSKIQGPLIGFVKKYWWILLVGLILVGGYFYMNWRIQSNIDQITYWQNETAKYRGLVKLGESNYEAQALKLDEITTENKELAKRLKETGRTLYQTQKLNLTYKVRLDSMIATQPATIVIHDTTYRNLDSTDRIFNVEFNNEFTLSGYFQTVSPFGIYIRDFSLKALLEVTIAQDRLSAWYWTIDTHSKYLKPGNVEIKIVELPMRWEYFIGSNVLFSKTEPYGIGAMVGVKRGSWSAFAGIDVINTGALYKIGVIKYWSF